MERSNRPELQSSNTSLPAGDEPVEISRGTHRGLDRVTYRVPGGYVALARNASGTLRLRNRFPAPSPFEAEWQLYELIHDLKVEEPTQPGGRHFLPGEHPAVTDLDLVEFTGGRS
jgi:hypothetical protein